MTEEVPFLRNCSVSSAIYARVRDDCLGSFISLNAPLGQSHDESRFTCFRLDLDLTAMPVSHDALAYRQAETFSRTDALCGEERLKDVRKILR